MELEALGPEARRLTVASTAGNPRGPHRMLTLVRQEALIQTAGTKLFAPQGWGLFGHAGIALAACRFLLSAPIPASCNRSFGLIVAG